MSRWNKGLVVIIGLFFCFPHPCLGGTTKVSGSIDQFIFYRDNFDLSDVVDEGLRNDVEAEHFCNIANLNISTSVSDRIDVFVHLLSQRDFAVDQERRLDIGDFNPGIELDQSYVEIREFTSLPATLKIGRMDISLGRGFLLGGNYTNRNILQAQEYTSHIAYDALKLSFPIFSWQLDAYYSTVNNSKAHSDDRDLYILDFYRNFLSETFVLENYFVADVDHSYNTAQAANHHQSTFNFGHRAQWDFSSYMTVAGEVVAQTGDFAPAGSTERRKRRAWAGNLFGEMRVGGAWAPRARAEWVYFSGEKDLSSTTTKNYHGFSNSTRSLVYGNIHDDLESYYTTRQAGDPAYAQNQMIWMGQGFFKPFGFGDLEVGVSYLRFLAVGDIRIDPENLDSPTLSKDIGEEWDASVRYTFNEQMSWMVEASYFCPGDLYSFPNNASASEVISTFSLQF